MSNIINRDTIGDMARRAATKYGDKTAIIFRNIKLSFYDLEREARRFANLMTRYGVRKGDRVAVYAYNSHYYPISMMGLAKIGAIQVPINYMLNAEEIAFIINQGRANVLACTATPLHKRHCRETVRRGQAKGQISDESVRHRCIGVCR